MAVEQAFKADIELNFDYKPSTNSSTKRYKIEPERISYIIIEHLYENNHILPVIYISVNLSSSIYSKVVDTLETSKFHLKITKRNALSKSSIKTKVVDDVFSYVTSTTNANYSDTLNNNDNNGGSYKGITIGLVSDNLTNILRTPFNGIYKNITNTKLINKAAKKLPNLIMEPLKYETTYKNILIPPLTSIYKFLLYMYNKNPYYDSMFTLYMDFNKSYLVSKNNKAVDGKDGKPSSVIIDIKNYTAAEAYKEGFSISNNAYLIYVNATNTQVVINNSTDKTTNNIVSYGDDNEVQNLTSVSNSTEGNNTKTAYVRSDNAAAIKNEMQNNSILIEILKQNLDPDIFTPNKVFNINHYGDYEKYNGIYILSYKKECYYQKGAGEFIMTCSIGLKKAAQEETAKSKTDTVTNKTNSKNSVKTSSSSKKKNNSSTKATRTVTPLSNKSSTRKSK